MTRYWFAASTEEFPPSQMLEQSVAAERAGFDALGSSDHFAPWWPDGQASQAWVTLAAIGQRTTLPIGTGVTPVVHHYHPGLIAQAFMSLEELYPRRVFLGVGSGEALNEVPLGIDWPEPAAIASSRKWKATQLEESYREDIHDPEEMLAKADEQMSDEEFAKQGFI